MSGRKLAVQLLDRTEREKSYSNLLLDHELSRSGLNDPERRLCSMLYYGVIKRRITLDTVLEKYSKQPLKKMDMTVRNILRIGIFQLCYCDQIPPHAAVSESVKLTRTLRKASASGFVNAVLRQFLRDGCQIPYPKEPQAAMAVRYAVPEWLLKRLVSAYGEAQTEKFLEDALMPAPRYVRRNPTACTKTEFEQTLGDKVTPVGQVSDAYLLHAGIGDIRTMPQFQKGWFYVQDLASQICALALGAQPGETILDVCAAPGGKTCTIAAQMQNRGQVYACDLSQHRVGLIQKNTARLGLSCVIASQADARKPHPVCRKADRVLCDVPCSGIGVLRRKPEVKEKDPSTFLDLPPLQLEILEQSSQAVKLGGILIYSTCTLLPEENSEVVMQFLQKHPEFQPVPVLPTFGDVLNQSMVTLFPDVCGSDGFFIAKLQKC